MWRIKFYFLFGDPLMSLVDAKLTVLSDKCFRLLEHESNRKQRRDIKLNP